MVLLIHGVLLIFNLDQISSKFLCSEVSPVDTQKSRMRTGMRHLRSTPLISLSSSFSVDVVDICDGDRLEHQQTEQVLIRVDIHKSGTLSPSGPVLNCVVVSSNIY